MSGVINRSTSLYLDLLRFLAALAVLFSHVSWHKLSGGFLWRLEPYGHPAVVVFFVLSGYVIAYTAEIKDHTLKDYALSRLARLYSVIIPALLLTAATDGIGQAVNPAPYVSAHETEPLFRLVMAALFLSHTWRHALTLMSNHAYWSMPYEFWYYTIFAAAFYFRGRARIVALGGGILIAGPNVLLMMPIWLLGVALCRYRDRLAMGRPLAAALFIGSWAAILAAEYVLDGQGNLFRQSSDEWPPGFSPFDYALALMVAANILAASCLPLQLERLRRPIRWAASYSFSIYLYHLPIFHFLAAVLPQDMSVAVRGGLMIAMTLGAVVALGSVTEHKKDGLRDFLENVFNAAGSCKASLRKLTNSYSGSRRSAPP